MTSANFLIDSESQLKAAVSGMARDEALRMTAMVERIIDFSARNRFIVFLLVFGLASGRPVGDAAHARSTPCRTSPTRRSSSTPPGWDARRTSSKIKSPIRSSPPCCRRRTSPWSGAFRTSAILVRLRPVQRRDGHLLGRSSRAGVHESARRAAAGGRHAAARSRRHGRRVGSFSTPWWMKRGQQDLAVTALLPGLVPPLLAARAWRASRKSPASAASSASIR